MFTFRGMTEDCEGLARRIRRCLQNRHAMHVGEIRVRLGVKEDVLQEQIGKMMAYGEIERLRPIDYPSDDHDFLRLNSPGLIATGTEDGHRFQGVTRMEEHVRMAGEAIACPTD